MQSATWFSLGLYFALMIGIGFYAWRKANATAQGYMLGGRDLGAGVTALSAGASDMSGWLLMGLPGAVYSGGLAAAWIGLQLMIGIATAGGMGQLGQIAIAAHIGGFLVGLVLTRPLLRWRFRKPPQPLN